MKNIIMAAAGAVDEKLYVDDVFSAYTYTGNGGTQTINNGIDLAGEGGLVWTKSRSAANSHNVYDTTRGANNRLLTNSTSAVNTAVDTIVSFNSNGFTVGSNDSGNTDASNKGISWTFRKAPKFFDVLNINAGPNGGGTFSHSLNTNVGMTIVKRTDSNESWYVFHKDITDTTKGLFLNTNDPLTNYGVGSGIYASTTSNVTFKNGVLTPNANYVVYLFAHDPSADGIIQCGSYTGPTAFVDLGWEPQYILVKNIDYGNEYASWGILDSVRGLSSETNYDYPLLADSAVGENSTFNSNVRNYIDVHANGFSLMSGSTLAGGVGTSSKYIYMAIRRPNKPPTVGTQVYNAIARTGTGAAATVTGVGFAPDLGIFNIRGTAGYSNALIDRLRGATQHLVSSNTNSERTASFTNKGFSSFDIDGVSLINDDYGFANESGKSYVEWFFKRAPGVFDVVGYTGTGANLNINHNLGVAPELVIVKCRTAIAPWGVYAASFGIGQTADFNSASGFYFESGRWLSAPTSTQFSVKPGATLNSAAEKYVAYLFASLPGISKVGTYNGTGASNTQIIDCGFTTGARFVMIKRVDAAGNWNVWDSARGIVAGNDPFLPLNTTDAENGAADIIDPHASGFSVTGSSATNGEGATYLFLAIA